MKFKQPIKKLGTLAAAGAAGFALALATAAPAHADATIDINPDHEGRTADYFETGCGWDSQVPDDKSADQDGWVFVLPGGSDNFTSVTAIFEDQHGARHTLTTDDDGAVVTGSGNNKAYILAPAGWTLVEATAVVSDADADLFFNVTHTCAGQTPEDGSTTTPPDGTPSPSPSTTPGDNPTSPGDDGSTTVPGEESTTPAGGALPTTGTPLTIALVSAAALAAGGAVLFLVMRRRQAAQDW